MRHLAFIDVAPEPVSTVIALAVILFVIGSVGLLGAVLLFFLWWRRRNARGVEMVPPNKTVSPTGIDQAYLNNPNQP